MYDFYSIIAPLTWLTQKNISFIWFDEYEESFQNLNTLLTFTPILTLSVEGEGFTLDCDALDMGLSSVLM